jgi:hypothetical protein
MSEEVKILYLNKNKSIENEARKLFSSVFSQNQLNLILKKKEGVHWLRYEVAKAFILRYLSKISYIYVKNELHYPLLGSKHIFFILDYFKLIHKLYFLCYHLFSDVPKRLK